MVVARFERHIEGAPTRCITSAPQRHHLGVIFARPHMMARDDNFAVFRNDDRPHRRIRRWQRLSRLFKSEAHHGDVEVRVGNSHIVSPDLLKTLGLHKLAELTHELVHVPE